MNPPPAKSSTGLDANIAAAIACFFSPLASLVFLLIEKQSPYVRFHSMQSLITGAAFLVLMIVLPIVSAILGFVPYVGWIISILLFLLIGLLSLAFFGLTLFLTYKAYSNTEWEIPTLGKIARQQLAKMAPLETK